VSEVLPFPSGSTESYLSYSQLSTYGDCPTKYRLRYVERVPAEASGAFIAGKVGHAIIERSEEAEVWRQDDAVQVLAAWFRADLATAVADAGGPDAVRWSGRAQILRDDEGKEVRGPDNRPIKLKETDVWWHHQGPAMLRRYVTIRRQLDAEQFRVRFTQTGRVDGIELKVTTRIAGRLIAAYIDAVLLADEDGQSAILDWKFGNYADPYQLAVYAEVLHRARGLDIDRGFIAYLRQKERDRWLVEFDLQRWRGQVEGDFAELAAGIEAGVFPKKRSSFCVSCSVRAHCSWGRTLEEGSHG